MKRTFLPAASALILLCFLCGCCGASVNSMDTGQIGLLFRVGGRAVTLRLSWRS